MYFKQNLIIFNLKSRISTWYWPWSHATITTALKDNGKMAVGESAVGAVATLLWSSQFLHWIRTKKCGSWSLRQKYFRIKSKTASGSNGYCFIWQKKHIRSWMILKKYGKIIFCKTVVDIFLFWIKKRLQGWLDF